MAKAIPPEAWLEEKVPCDSCLTKIRESRLRTMPDGKRWCQMCIRHDGDWWTR